MSCWCRSRESSAAAFPAPVWGFGFRVSGFGFRVSGFGFRVSCFGFRVSGFGFWVSGLGLDRRPAPAETRPSRARRGLHPPACAGGMGVGKRYFFIELMTSGRKLKASREGSKGVLRMKEATVQGVVKGSTQKGSGVSTQKGSGFGKTIHSKGFGVSTQKGSGCWHSTERRSMASRGGAESVARRGGGVKSTTLKSTSNPLLSGNFWRPGLKKGVRLTRL